MSNEMILIQDIENLYKDLPLSQMQQTFTNMMDGINQNQIKEMFSLNKLFCQDMIKIIHTKYIHEHNIINITKNIENIHNIVNKEHKLFSAPFRYEVVTLCLMDLVSIISHLNSEKQIPLKLNIKDKAYEYSVIALNIIHHNTLIPKIIQSKNKELFKTLSNKFKELVLYSLFYHNTNITLLYTKCKISEFPEIVKEYDRVAEITLLESYTYSLTEQDLIKLLNTIPPYNRIENRGIHTIEETKEIFDQMSHAIKLLYLTNPIISLNLTKSFIRKYEKNITVNKYHVFAFILNFIRKTVK